MKNNKEILVSIIVPIYKCEKQISNCIESILKQTHSQIEVLLVNDGNFDHSLQICKDYENKDNRVKVIEIEHSGVSVARNEGIMKSRGEWLAFIDSDDWIDPSYIEALLISGLKTNSDIVICGYYAEDMFGHTKFNFLNKEGCFLGKEKDVILENSIVCTDNGNRQSIANIGVPWAKLYKKELIAEHNLLFVPRLKRMQDMIFNLYAFSYAKKITLIKEHNYHYLVNNLASTHSFQPNFNKTANDILKELVKFSVTAQKKDLISKIHDKAVLLTIEMIDLEFVHKDCNLSTKKKINRLKKILKENTLIFDCIRASTGKFLSFNQNIARVLLKYRLFFIIYFLQYFHNIKKTKKIIKIQK